MAYTLWKLLARPRRGFLDKYLGPRPPCINQHRPHVPRRPRRNELVTSLSSSHLGGCKRQKHKRMHRPAVRTCWFRGSSSITPAVHVITQQIRRVCCVCHPGYWLSDGGLSGTEATHPRTHSNASHVAPSFAAAARVTLPWPILVGRHFGAEQAEIVRRGSAAELLIARSLQNMLVRQAAVHVKSNHGSVFTSVNFYGIAQSLGADCEVLAYSENTHQAAFSDHETDLFLDNSDK